MSVAILADIEWLKSFVEVLKNVAELFAFAIGAAWALYKIAEYRELKHRLGFEIEAELFLLTSPVAAPRPTWNSKLQLETIAAEPLTHVVEIRAHFDNRGNRRFRLYNLQFFVNTMRAAAETKFDTETGRVVLRRVHTSGNVVPEETSFFYVEPGVKQTISYLTLLPPPTELVQVVGEFSLEQHRIFPKARIGKMRLLPHSAAKTYRV